MVTTNGQTHPGRDSARGARHTTGTIEGHASMTIEWLRAGATTRLDSTSHLPVTWVPSPGSNPAESRRRRHFRRSTREPEPRIPGGGSLALRGSRMSHLLA